MSGLKRRLEFLFGTTNGLILVAVGMVTILLTMLGTLSGPIAELGFKDLATRVLGFELVDEETTGRIVMLYHAIAVAVVAIEVYIINDLLRVRPSQRRIITAAITPGYIMTLVFGIAFAYFGHHPVFHGLFLVGLSLVFFAGIVLAAAIWPWRAEHRRHDREYAVTRSGLDLERLAFFTVAVATLGSAIFGAIPGSFMGFGFEAFLAEDIVREAKKSALQLSVIGHLHIMVTLVAIALALIIGRWLDFKGRLHKVAMPLMIAGTIILTAGVWLVVPFEEIAHFVIYGGSMPVLLGALFLVIFGLRKLARSPKDSGTTPGFVAMISDPLKFGSLWQMIFMNFVVTFVGIFMAMRLDEIRAWPTEQERVITTGHWHILAGVMATIIILYLAARTGLAGKARAWFAWPVIIGSDLAFAAMTAYELRPFFGAAPEPGPTGIILVLTDIGMMITMVALGALLIWLISDLFRRKGRWTAELARETAGDVKDGTPG